MTVQRIALDVMGGDHAPRAILEGALTALGRDDDAAIDVDRIVLVGDEAVIRSGLDELGGDPGFTIQHASQVIEMGESPSRAVRGKPDSSIAVAVGTLKAGRAGAVVSMGNTGAVVGASTIGLGTLPGVRRPGIAVTLRITDEPLTILDMGANVAPKAQHLRQYGVMGSVFLEDVLGISSPRVGLLNIGEEEKKGTDLLKEAHTLLAQSPIEFVGNVEPSEIFSGDVHVVVTDGFTGNVVLKLLEGFAGILLGLVGEELVAHGADWARETLGSLRRRVDYAEYGGALLLGVGGTVVIGHGRSDARAVANALALAARAMDRGVNDHIVKGIGGELADA